jgi:hypothetical protein
LASTDTVSPVGADIIYLGHFAELLQGDIGDWDFLNLGYYPNRRAMYDMIHSPDYQKVEHFRSNALEKALLYVRDAAGPTAHGPFDCDKRKSLEPKSPSAGWSSASRSKWLDRHLS